MANDELILVNDEDKIIGYEEKWKCHSGKGLRHRAFSVFIFNSKNELLIQKRSSLKKLWAGFWANSCCSHPAKGESRVKAGERRLVEELGFTCKLKELFKYAYSAKFENIGSENEVNAVLIGHYDNDKNVKANPDEIAEWKWVLLDWLEKDIAKNESKYAPWFVIGLKKFLEEFKPNVLL